jgi:hypothetical protein
VIKLDTWKTKEQAGKELNKRLTYSREQKNRLNYRWAENERLVFNTKGGNLSQMSNLNIPIELVQGEQMGVDQAIGSVGTNYLFKNLRFIHAQMSANPPSVLPRPTSPDISDKKSADAADRIVRFAIREYQLQEKQDRMNLNALLYGTGFIKVLWDKNTGDILEVNEETGEMVMEGDISVTVPNPWDIFVDPEATNWDDVRFVFEKITMPYESAIYMWPDSAELLETVRQQSQIVPQGMSGERNAQSETAHQYYDSVELYEYWEKGLPVNGYLGRHCVCTKDGLVLGEIDTNPERYRAPGKKTYPKAHLPYFILTDIDVPNSVWGKSFVEFGTALQDTLNKLDTLLLENVQAHGVARLILPEGTEIADDSITNSPWDIIKITGNQAPQFMPPMPLPAGMDNLRITTKMGLDDISGVNEAMFGQASRETSGFSMQYATNQGNMIRRRLFNKYTIYIEHMYRRILQIAQTRWDVARSIKVIGKEKAFEIKELKGADLEGGYDLVVEYGASFSLDPTTRREEILTLMPLFEKAGMKPKEILNKLKLNELPGMFDRMEMAADRQTEIFQRIMDSGMQVQPEQLQDHASMLEYCYDYVMTAEFKGLPIEIKQLIREHIRLREQFAAEEQARLAQAAGGAPGPAPQGPAGAPPALPGAAGPMDVTQLAGMLTG